jgi:hypothetical protein
MIIGSEAIFFLLVYIGGAAKIVQAALAICCSPWVNLAASRANSCCAACANGCLREAPPLVGRPCGACADGVCLVDCPSRGRAFCQAPTANPPQLRIPLQSVQQLPVETESKHGLGDKSGGESPDVLSMDGRSSPARWEQSVPTESFPECRSTV